MPLFSPALVFYSEIRACEALPQTAHARADFRRVGENAISVNVCLPDLIFETDKGGKRLAKFTYKERWNLLSMAKAFSQLAITALSDTLHCLESVEEPSFTFSSRKSERTHSQ